MITGWLKRIYGRLPVLREMHAILGHISVTNDICRNIHRQILLSRQKYQDPRKLNSFEAQAFSQNGEDGILAEIFHRIGMDSKIFVELGVGDGLENNTVFLLFQGWRGFWIEGDAKANKQITKSLGKKMNGGSPASDRVAGKFNCNCGQLGGGSDWSSTLYSRGPVNNPSNPDQFVMFADSKAYVSNEDLGKRMSGGSRKSVRKSAKKSTRKTKKKTSKK